MRLSTDHLIPLKHGFVVPERVFTWLLNAEDRGLTFTVAGDKLRVGPPARVRQADDRFIRDHKDLIRACVSYCDRMREEPL